MVRRITSAFIVAAAALLFAAPAVASSGVQFGVQDDAWLLGGPGTFDERLEQVKDLGVDVVRVNIRWDTVARPRPRSQTDPLDPAYRWGAPDALLEGLRRWKITPVVTLVGSPRWANGGRAPNWAPKSPTALANFATAAATRYPWVRRWVIWN